MDDCESFQWQHQRVGCYKDRIEALEAQIKERDEALAEFRAFVRADDAVHVPWKHRTGEELTEHMRSVNRRDAARAAVEPFMGDGGE